MRSTLRLHLPMVPARAVSLRTPPVWRVGWSRRGSVSDVHCMSNYRWSAERSGRRKRESLYDNLEPEDIAGPSQQPPSYSYSSGSSGSSSSSSTWQGPAWAQQPQQTPTPPQEQEPDPSLWGASAGGPFQASSSSSSGGGKGGWEGPPPGAWGDWDPTAVDPSQFDDFGWAAESWAGGSSRPQGPGQQQQQQRGEGQQLPPGSDPAASGSWGSSWNPAEHHSYGGTRWEAHAADHDQQQQQGMGTGAYQGAGGPGPGPMGDDGEGEYSDSYEPGLVPPDIALLSPNEMERTLPVIPFSLQAAYFSKGAVTSVQRWGASLAATVLLSKVVLLAATSLSWPLWWPWYLAWTKNYNMRKQYKYAGLWRTQILGVEITGRPKAMFGEQPEAGGGLASIIRLARFMIGDPGGARTEMTLAYDSRYELVGEGEPAELIVLSDSPSFESFKAVKDVYLPSCGVWLTDYPYVDRTAFLEVSLEVERELAEEAQQAQQRQAQPQQQGAPYGGGPPGGGYYSGGGY